MQRIETGRAPILAWVDGVEFEDSARRQVENIATCTTESAQRSVP
jgi:hypothetical protein